jgi:hypothetical protein
VDTYGKHIMTSLHCQYGSVPYLANRSVQWTILERKMIF